MLSVCYDMLRHTRMCAAADLSGPWEGPHMVDLRINISLITCSCLCFRREDVMMAVEERDVVMAVYTHICIFGKLGSFAYLYMYMYVYICIYM